MYEIACADAQSSVRAGVRLVTPEWAGYVLANLNCHNRALSKRYEAIAAAIRSGKWMMTGHPIVFLRSGALGDGQHRLKAVMVAGIAVPCLVVTGVEDEAFACFDINKRRGNADVLSIDGNKNTTTLAAAINWIKAAELGGLDKISLVSVKTWELRDIVADHPGLAAAVTYASSKHTRAASLPTGLMAYLRYEFDRRCPDLAEQFCSRFYEGVDIQRDTTEYMLRKALLSRFGGSKTRQENIDMGAIVIKAWNAIRTNSRVKLLRYNSESESFPEIL